MERVCLIKMVSLISAPSSVYRTVTFPILKFIPAMLSDYYVSWYTYYGNKRGEWRGIFFFFSCGCFDANMDQINFRRAYVLHTPHFIVCHAMWDTLCCDAASVEVVATHNSAPTVNTSFLVKVKCTQEIRLNDACTCQTRGMFSLSESESGQMRKAESMHRGQMKMKEFLSGSEISSSSYQKASHTDIEHRASPTYPDTLHMSLLHMPEVHTRWIFHRLWLAVLTFTSWLIYPKFVDIKTVILWDSMRLDLHISGDWFFSLRAGRFLAMVKTFYRYMSWGFHSCFSAFICFCGKTDHEFALFWWTGCSRLLPEVSR